MKGLQIPNSARTGISWPAVPAPEDAALLALQYQFEQSQWWPPETLLQAQLSQLEGVLAHAAQTVRFYRERLRATWAETGKGRTLEGPARILWIEVARQAVADLQRAIDALAGIPEVDCKRVAFAGFSLGAMIGGVFCALDPRPRAAALALAAGGIGPVEVDPCSYVGAIAPRPVLLIGAEDDATIPRTATEALFAAAGEPKQLEWYEGTHQRLPGVALKTMWSFLAKALELAR